MGKITSTVMDDENREELSHLQTLADDDDFHAGDAPNFPEMINVDDFLTGAEQVDLSHAGGELGSLEEDIEEDLVAEDRRRGRYSFPFSMGHWPGLTST
jgi:hypothetical protein